METINDLLNQILTLHTGALLIAAVLVTGYIIKGIPWIPNTIIPLITFAVCVSGNVLLGDVGQVSPFTSTPQVRLGFVGVAYWGIAWLIHNQGLARLEKFLPAPLRSLIGSDDPAPQHPTPISASDETLISPSTPKDPHSPKDSTTP